MPRIVTSSFTVPADETPAYSEWGEVGAATSVDAAVTVSNDQSPDLWIQWTDDTAGPEPEDLDVFSIGSDPVSHGKHYYVYVNGLTPAGAYIRVKGIAYGADADCHVTVDAN